MCFRKSADGASHSRDSRQHTNPLVANRSSSGDGLWSNRHLPAALCEEDAALTEYWTNGVAALHQADARAMPLPDASVHMVCTSPPYWGLRDYGLGQWQGGDAECGHVRLMMKDATSTLTGGNGNANSNHAAEGWPNNTCGHCGAVNTPAGIGLEPTLGEWVQNIVAVMREVRRVLRDDGTVWLNLGDAYASGTKGTGGNSPKQNSHPGSFSPEPIHLNMSGLPAKNLMGQPWRVAFALQDDGWLLRSAIVWHKPNPMPESARDRPTNAYEMIFLLAKAGKYFYDAEAVRVPHTASTLERVKHALHTDGPDGPGRKVGTVHTDKMGDRFANPNGANARNVWSIPTQGRPDAHFATYPDELPRRCILAGTSERGVCADCGAPWARQTEKSYENDTTRSGRPAVGNNAKGTDAHGFTYAERTRAHTQTLGWQPTCGCNAAIVPATVLDPFAGSGTTLAVAQALGRKSVGLDLNPEYLEIAKKYINRADGITLPMALA